MKAIFLFIAGVILAFRQFAYAASPKCAKLAPSDPAALIQFLKARHSGDADPFCIEYALRKLGDQKILEAMPVIASYLDFHRTETEREKMGFGGAIGTPGNEFPAVFALSQMGHDALLTLVHVIETEENAVVHKNAIYTTLRIFHDGVAAIHFLQQSASTGKSKDARDRLSGAAHEAVLFCNPSERSNCESAAADTVK